MHGLQSTGFLTMRTRRPSGAVAVSSVAPKIASTGTPAAAAKCMPPESLEMNAKIAFAVQRMDLGGFRHVPIVDDRKHLTGIISVRDILKYLTERISATEKA